MYQGMQADFEQAVQEVFTSGLLVSLCTAQSPDTAQGPEGNPVGTYTNVPGLINIPCMDAVLAPGTIDATETKELQDILSKSFRHVALNGYYPQFFTNSSGSGGASDGWRVTVDGVIYDLLGAEPDSQSTQTRLKLQLATVGS